jgi:rhodanese-related sulfurtransferase
MMRKFLLLVLFTIVYPVNAQVKKFSNINTLSPAEFYSRIIGSGNFVIIDIRDRVAYDSVRIENSICISSEERLKQFSDSLDTDVPVYLYSEDGSNSAEGCIILLEKGILNVFELEGGIYAYRRAYLPVDKRKADKF